jgi:NADH-quinone oxidoreductase subunit J
VTCPHPVHALLYLVLSLLAVATVFFTLGAPFAGVLEVVVYAGAIMVLILFVIMLLNLGTEARWRYTHGVVWSSIASLLVLLNVLFFIKRGRVTGSEGDITDYLIMTEGHTELIGKSLYTEFLLPFEIASILLLVAIVGAVVLAKKDV